jgi:hypothetical protein
MTVRDTVAMFIDFRLLGPNDVSVLRNVAPDVFDDPIDMRAAAAFLNDPRHVSPSRSTAIASSGSRRASFTSTPINRARNSGSTRWASPPLIIGGGWAAG